MTPPQVLMARLVVAVAFSAATLALVSSRKLEKLPEATFDRLVRTAFVVSRVGLFVLLFLVLRLPPRGDINIYVDQARAVLDGRLPYRDFVSAYAPLYPYLNAGLLLLSKTGLAIMFMAIVCECATVWLWLGSGRKFFTDREVRLGALLYLGSALSVQYISVDGQNNSLAGLTVAAAVVVLARYRSALSGFLLGVGISVVKFLPLIYAPLFFMTSPRRWLWVGGLVLCCVPVYGWFVLHHAPILVPVMSEGSLRTSGNLPYVIEMVFGLGLPDRLYDGTVAVALLAIFGLVFRVTVGATHEVRMRALSFGMAAVIVAAVLFSKKSWPPYLILALFPICLTVPAKRTCVLLFALFNVASCLEPSAWWLASSAQGVEMHRHLVARVPAAMGFLPLDLLMVAAYSWLLMLAVRGILGRSAEAGEPVV